MTPKSFKSQPRSGTKRRKKVKGKDGQKEKKRKALIEEAEHFTISYLSSRTTASSATPTSAPADEKVPAEDVTSVRTKLFSSLSTSTSQDDDDAPSPEGVQSTAKATCASNEVMAARYAGDDHLVVGNTAYPSVATASVICATEAIPSTSPVIETASVVMMCAPGGTYGVEFFPGGSGGAVVKSVKNRSPADLAGLCAGDEVLVINGKAATDVTLANIADLMRSKHGKEPIRLEVGRANSNNRVRSLYKKEGTGVRIVTIPKTRGVGGMGFSLTMSPQDREIVIREVVPGGAADMAGLQNNDVVLAAAGRDMSDYSTLIEVFRFLKLLKELGMVSLRIERRSTLSAGLAKLKVAVTADKDPLAGAPLWWKDKTQVPATLVHSPSLARK